MDIQSLLTLPDNWQWGKFNNKNGNELRYGFNAPPNAKSLVILAEGRTECIEEYFETIRDLNKKGHACAIMDWQGQGLSYRYFDDNTRHHSEGFENSVFDFSDFLNLINKNSNLKSLPKILIAHSMGGNIAMRYMVDNPDTFKCAVMITPMLGLMPKRLIKYIVPSILKIATTLKRLSKHALGQSKWSKYFANIAKYKVSSDKIRREVQPYLFETKSELQCGGVTNGWIKEALKSINFLQNQKTAQKITTPTFFAIAGKDIVVDNDATKLIATNMPHATIEMFDDAQHQLHRENDKIRNTFYKYLHRFIKKHLPS